MLKRAQLWLSSIAIAALMAGASAQTWDETADGGGDAGDLPASAQVVLGNPNNPLTQITGSISDTDIADLYQIIICDPANFYAHTGTTSETTFDSRLSLFDSQGKPLWSNDDRPSAVSATPPNGVVSVPTSVGEQQQVTTGAATPQLPLEVRPGGCQVQGSTIWQFHAGMRTRAMLRMKTCSG